MTTPSNFWADFEPINQTRWEEAVRLSLKGKPYESLLWQPDKAIQIAPAYFSTEGLATQIPTQRADNQWWIVEGVSVDKDWTAARTQALAALAGGANSLYWDIAPSVKRWEQLQTLCEGIHLGMIESHWYGAATQSFSFLQFLYLVVGDIAGSVAIPEADEDGQLWAMENMPRMRIWSYTAGKEQDAATQLARILQQCDALLRSWLDKRVEVEEIATRIQIVLPVGDAYLLEVAKLRAFRRLWATWLSAYTDKYESLPPHILTKTLPSQPDPHSHKIAATAQAMAAVLGHTDSLWVQPAADTELERRMARNIQHLLIMESHLDAVIDPTAGAYYFEQLTDQVAQAAWKQFQSL